MLDGDDYPSFDTVQKSTIQLAVDNTSEHFCVHRRQLRFISTGHERFSA